MSRRTQIFTQLPWTGGWNTSVDPGVLHPNDLQQADNVIFTVSGSRLKRDGISYFDSAIPSVIKRSSSGTTRTLQFASSVSLTGPTDQIIVVGENLSITGAGNSNYNNTNCVVASVTTTTITNDTITYTFSGAASLTESLVAETAAVVVRNYDILGVYDFWWYDVANNVKKQNLVAVSSQGLIFSYDLNGKRTQIPAAGGGATAITAPLTTVDMLAFNNKLIFALSGVGNTPKVWDPTTATWVDLTGSPPDFSIMREHLGRIWTNNKTSRDRLYYSGTFDETKWQGVGDSSALDLSVGDGDPVGITAILPPFQGVLIVNKSNRSYKIYGLSPEEFYIVNSSKGIGSVSHKAAVAVDNDDVFFTSKQGFHSLITTEQYGDFKTKYLSRDVQPTFNSLAAGNLQYSQATYVPTLNSIAVTVAEVGQTKSNAIWLYNPTIEHANQKRGVWYRWPNVFAQSICTRLDNNILRIVFGDSSGRINICQNTLYNDYTATSINYRIKSGTIYVDNNPNTIKAFKRISLLYKPRGAFNFTAYFTVDNFPPQAFVFQQTAGGRTLGGTFTLGSSVLGSSNVLAPFSQDVVGYGRGCTIEIFQTGLQSQVEIYGFAIEYEAADIANEVLLSGTKD